MVVFSVISSLYPLQYDIFYVLCSWTRSYAQMWIGVGSWVQWSPWVLFGPVEYAWLTVILEGQESSYMVFLMPSSKVSFPLRPKWLIPACGTDSYIESPPSPIASAMFPDHRITWEHPCVAGIVCTFVSCWVLPVLEGGRSDLQSLAPKYSSQIPGEWANWVKIRQIWEKNVLFP